MRYRDGNLITLAKDGHFNLITHGCNCFCTMGSGIAPQIAKAFPEAYDADQATTRGDFNKLGNYSFGFHGDLTIVNSYTQYNYNVAEKPLDYEALAMCMRKINHAWSGLTIGLPKIGAGLAGGDWNIIEHIIKTELNAMDVWIVNYKP